jgi:hypothetical protein
MGEGRRRSNKHASSLYAACLGARDATYSRLSAEDVITFISRQS